MRILFTGGGTGGHIYPLVAVARAIKKTNQDTDLLFIGPNGFSRSILEKNGIRTKIILAGKFRRYFSWKMLIDFLKIPLGLIQAFWYVYLFMPDVVFAKGGYGSFQVAIVSWIYRIPILVHESDAVPGLTNKILFRFSKRIALSFPLSNSYLSSHSEKIALIGNPIRTELLKASKEEAYKFFDLRPGRKVILVLGGSQGAQVINEVILKLLGKLTLNFDIIHQCGLVHLKEMRTFSSVLLSKYDQPHYRLFGFLDEKGLKYAYALADLVISRAGSGTIFEIAALSKPSIIIPLPTAASDHQKMNAYVYAESGATTVIEQRNLTPNLLLTKIESLLDNPELLAKMSKRAHNFSKINAAEKIAQELLFFN